MTGKRIGKFFSISHRYAMIFFKNRMADIGLGQSHHGVLITLYKEQGISQEALRRKLNIDKANVTRSVKKTYSRRICRKTAGPKRQTVLLAFCFRKR